MGVPTADFHERQLHPRVVAHQGGQAHRVVREAIRQRRAIVGGHHLALKLARRHRPHDFAARLLRRLVGARNLVVGAVQLVECLAYHRAVELRGTGRGGAGWDVGDLVVARVDARQHRADTHRTRGRGARALGQRQGADQAVEPAILRRLAPRRGGLHVVLRVEVRPGGIGRTRGVNEAQLAGLPQRHQRLQRGVQAEAPVQLQRAAFGAGPA